MDGALFSLLFFFFIQISAGVAPVRWPQCTWLAGWIFWISSAGALACLVWYVYSNFEIALAYVDMVGRTTIGIIVFILGAAIGVGGLSLIGSSPRPNSSTATPTADLKPDSAAATKPSFRMSLEGAQIFEFDQFESANGILLLVNIWNVGAPSAVTNWNLTVRVEGHDAIKASLMSVPHTLTLKGNPTVYTPKDDLYLRTRTAEISRTPVSGRLLFSTSLSRAALLLPATSYELTATDIFENEFKSRVSTGEWLSLKKKEAENEKVKNP